MNSHMCIVYTCIYVCYMVKEIAGLLDSDYIQWKYKSLNSYWGPFS